MLCVLLRSLLNGGLQVEPAPRERHCHFSWRASHFTETPRVNVTPATIESTAALPCGPRPFLAAGARRVFLLHPVRIPIERKRTRRRLLSSRQWSVPHPVARACNSGALPAWPTCRTGG